MISLYILPDQRRVNLLVLTIFSKNKISSSLLAYINGKLFFSAEITSSCHNYYVCESASISLTQGYGLRNLDLCSGRNWLIFKL